MRSLSIPAANNVRAYVAAHLSDDSLTADDVLTVLGLHYARPQIRLVLGQPLGAYIRACRLEEACRLLRDTELPLIHVAFEVGYGSHEALTHAFRRSLGMTPSAYRQQARALKKQNDQTG